MKSFQQDTGMTDKNKKTMENIQFENIIILILKKI